MAAVQNPIGRNLYLFHDDSGCSDFLLITAHGIAAPGTFKVPSRTQLNFYAPSKQFLVMPQSMFELGTQVKEQLNPGSDCSNYVLSKYQGRHGDIKETYNSLKNKINDTNRQINGFDQSIRDIRNSPNNIYDKQTKEKLVRQTIDQSKNLFKLDFLTIRNRNYFNPVSFKGVLDELNRSGYNYNHIFCSFCRGRIPFVDRTHTAQKY